MREFEAIAAFYGDRTAARSGVPLISHITEGLQILEGLHANRTMLAAFCLHPIVQNGEPVDVSWSDAFPLACEYRDKANAYLCRPATDHVTEISQVAALVGDMSIECAVMLLADKLQNKKDFLRYHSHTHARRRQLTLYFQLWLTFLEDQLTAQGWWHADRISLLHRYVNGQSIPQLVAATGIGSSALWGLLKRTGLLRSRRDGIRQAGQQGRLGGGWRGKPRQLSPSHAANLTKANRKPRRRDARGRFLPLTPCATSRQ